MKKNHSQKLETALCSVAVTALSLLIALIDFDMDSWVFGLQSGFMIVAGFLIAYAIVAARRISHLAYTSIADVEQAYTADRKGMWLTGIVIYVVAALLVFILYHLPVKSVYATVSGFLLAGVVETALFSLVTSLVWKRFMLHGRNHEQGEACN